MGYVIIILGFGIVGYGFYKFYQLFKVLFYKSENIQEQNPYIEMHKSVLGNDKNYDEYLNHLSKNHPDQVPLDKIKTYEEIELERKINALVD